MDALEWPPFFLSPKRGALVAMKRKLGRKRWENVTATCNLSQSPAIQRPIHAILIPIHGTTSWPLKTWRLMIMGFWGVSRPSHWKWRQVAGLVNQISKRVEWGGCKFWISKRKSSPRLNLNQPWIVSAILSYIIYYICILGCSVL